jgi:hypothetical protein
LNRKLLYGGAFAGTLIIGIAIGDSGHSSAATQPPPSQSHTTTETVTSTVTKTVSGAAAQPQVRTETHTVTVTAAAPTQKPASAPTVVFQLSGSGIKNTPDFHVANDSWTIAYTWNCQPDFSFSAYLGGDGMDVISNPARSGSDSTSEHGAGTYHLDINAGTCTWTVKVTQ